MSDKNLIFERYLGILKEAVPFAAPEEGFGAPEQITRHKPVLSGRQLPSGYRIGKYAQETGRDIVELTREIVDAIKTEVFIPQNTHVGGVDYPLYFPGTKEQLHNRITSIIHQKLGGSATESNYSARIIMNHILKLADVEKGRIVTKELDPVEDNPQVQRVIQAVAVNNEVRGEQPGGAPPEAVPEPTEVKPSKPMANFKLTGEYMILSPDDVEEAALKKQPGLQELYMWLYRNVGANIDSTGSDLVRSIMRYGDTSVGEGKAWASELLNVGAIIKKEENVEPSEGEEIPALDAPTEPNIDDIVDQVNRGLAGGRSERHGLE